MTSKEPGETTATLAQRAGWAALLVVTLAVCYFSHLGVIGFVGPDEPRYAWIARDMAETGDWVTPRLYGKPWLEKPPLLYWGGAIFFHVLPGQPEVAARLPSAISALLATLALAWLAWRTYGEECARWLLLLLPTSVGMIGFSHAAATDMPFAGMLTIAMVCAAVVLGLVPNQNSPGLPSTPWAALLLFGFFLGLAVLAKGPAAIILCGGAVFFWAIFSQRWRDAFRLLHPMAVLAFCTTALPWYILCARRNPDFFRVFIIEHNFKRYLTPEFQHLQPFWFYGPVLLVAFLPWTFLLIAVACAALGRLWRSPSINSLSSLALSWSLFSITFFSVSKSKLPGYILPAVPALALLFAHGSSGREWFSRKFSARMLSAGACVYLAAAIWARFRDQESSLHGHSIKRFVFLTCGLFAFSSLFAGLSFSIKRASAFRLPVLACSVLALLLSIAAIPKFQATTNYNLLSARDLWRALPQQARSSGGLRTYGFGRDYRYTLSFYLHQEVLDWNEDRVSDGYVAGNPVNCERLQTDDNCRSVWSDYDRAASWTLVRITPKDSFNRPGDGREPK